MTESTCKQVEAIRSFNRFYTRQLGLLDECLLASQFTLAEVRVLYELAHRPPPTSTEISKFLRLDPGYLSRIIKKFEDCGLLVRKPSEKDGRSVRLWLTGTGSTAFAPLDQASSDQVKTLLEPLSRSDRERLVNSMSIVRGLLTSEPDPSAASFCLRAHRPGDIGWAIERHGVLYADEFGWNEEFEGLVAEILGAFLKDHDPKRQRCWIAESGNQRAGCVFLVANETRADTAQLRCLLIEPWARGLGIGGALVDECIKFARVAGYKRMVLWTNDVLVAARRIYEAAGFELVEKQRHHSFGRHLVGQTWSLTL